METNFELEEELSLSRDVGRQNELLHQRLHFAECDVIEVREHARLTHDAHRRAPVMKLEHRHILQTQRNTSSHASTTTTVSVIDEPRRSVSSQSYLQTSTSISVKV